MYDTRILLDGFGFVCHISIIKHYNNKHCSFFDEWIMMMMII
jgi:hypothetical protein